jgi:hypothetical protein
MSLGSPCERSLVRRRDQRSAATYENSISEMARYAALAPVLAGALLLIVAEFVTVREIRALTAVPPGGTETGGGLHLYALGVIGLAMLPMGVGAVLGDALPAKVALLSLALLAAGIILVVDVPALDETGLIGRTYELAEARPATGFYLESLGAALALVGAVAAIAGGVTRRR